MQSSCKVIKNNYVITNGKEEICTIIPAIDIEENEDENKDQLEAKEPLIEPKIDLSRFQKMAEHILENSRQQSAKIIVDATKKAKTMEVEAFEKGHKEGYEKGYAEGLDKGYEDGFTKAKEEGQSIIDNANEILKNSKIEYKRYIEEKEVHIREVILKTVSSILNIEFEDKDSMNNIIFEALENEKNESYFIIKCNSTYKESIKDNIDNMKNKLAFNGDIFVIEDNSLKNGECTIEKEDGKISINKEFILEKLKELIFER